MKNIFNDIYVDLIGHLNSVAETYGKESKEFKDVDEVSMLVLRKILKYQDNQ